MTTWVSARKYVTAGVIHPVLVKLWDHVVAVTERSDVNPALKKAAGLLSVFGDEL